MLCQAVLEMDGPVAIRYPKGGDGAYDQPHWSDQRFEEAELTMVTYGTTINDVLEAAQRLRREGRKVDVIKLDRTFVPTDRDQGRSARIVSSMLEMAQSLHLPVVIEGIETNEQANMLRHMGARYAQGFLYYRPMQAKDFEALLDGGNNN